jgi:hypothetical protein
MSEPSAYPDWVPPPLIEAIEWTHAEEAWERLLLRDQEDIAAFVGPPDASRTGLSPADRSPSGGSGSKVG